MIRPKKYLPVTSQVFYAPLIKENLRLEFASFEYKLNDLALLTILMLRDKKTAEDIAAVTLLRRDIIENVIETLKSQGTFAEQNIYNLPEQTRKILALSECINSFNVNAPPIFSDLLTKSPIILPQAVKPQKNFDDTISAAVVKNFKRVRTADFEDVSNFVKNFLRGHGAGEFLDELKVLRLQQTDEVLFAARQLRFLPVVGEGNFFGVNFDSARAIIAELPVRKFKSADGKELCVDLLLGTTFEAADIESSVSEEIILSFKPNPKLKGGEDVQYIKISVAEEVAGDFLCV